MAIASQATGATDRRLLVVALAALGGVTGAAFGRVFVGSASAARLAVAGALAVAIAAVLQRRHLMVSLAVSGAALVALIGLVVFPDTTWGGLPTRATLVEITRALGRVGERAATEIAPARPLPALLTAGLIAVWAAATAAHALAIRSRSTVLPLLPPAALLAFAGVVTDDGSRPGYVLAFLVAAFAVLFAGGLHRMAMWGRVLPRPGQRRLSLGGGMTGRWARLLGLAALAVALILPGLIPGFGASPLLDLGAGAGRVGVSPIVDIRPSLLQNPPADLFFVESLRPAYWRLAVLDRFDGRLWTASDLRAENGFEVRGTSPLPSDLDVEGARLDQRIEIRDLSTQWLPAAYEPVEVQLGEDVVARHDPASGMLVSEEEPSDGYVYGVTSQLIVPSEQGLDEAFRSPNRAQLGRYTELPITVPDRIYGIAREITEKARTPFRQILAVQEYLRDFMYNERAPAGHGVDDMLFFLERSHEGYCEQFAGTMAVLLRTLGYPARVAVGFLPGTRTRDGRFRVTTSDIHAWPEVHVPTYGWLAFEPTPTRSNPVADYLIQIPVGPRPDSELGPGSSGQSAGRGAAQREAFELQPQARGGGPPARPAPVREDRWPWGTIVLGLLGLALLTAALIPLAKTAGRRLVIARAESPRWKVIAAFRVLEAGAADLGLGRRTGETLWEYRSRLRSEVSLSNGHLDRITGLTGRALYSTRHLGPEHAREAVDASRSVLSDLRRHVGAVRRAAGAVRPSRPVD